MISLICGISKNNINEQTKQKRTHSTENRLMVARGGLGERGEGIEKYKLAVTKQPWRCIVRQRKYSQ